MDKVHVLPSSTTDPLARTRAIVHELPEAQQRVADQIVADPEWAVRAAVEGIARRARVSAPTVVRFCRSLGYDVRCMDQSFLDFPAASFDAVWCRHCLEHSIYPYFTLSGFHRVLKPGGWLYVEVPAPDTASAHQTNRNHYSVLGKSMMASLLDRSRFRIAEVLDITFTVPAGPDTYWAFIQQRI